MNIKVNSSKLIQNAAEAIVMPFFEDEKKLNSEILELDKAIGGAISRAFKQKRLTGKLGESEIFHSLGDIPANLIVVLGLGNKSLLEIDKLRGAVGGLCRTLRHNKVSSIAVETRGISVSGANLSDVAQAMVEGALLGLYTFRRHITKKQDHDGPTEITLVCTATEALAVKSGVEKGRIMDMGSHAELYDRCDLYRNLCKEYLYE